MLIRTISFLFVLLVSLARPVPAAEAPAGVTGPAAEKAPNLNPLSLIRDPQLPPAGLSFEEAMRLGEAMYLKGMLPSGKPMEATVHGDIKVSSATSVLVTCSNCHMRSGLGSFEGLVLTLPTNGAKLYAPLIYAWELPAVVGSGEIVFENPRPAYTDEILADALRYGIDPAGRLMLETMPRYILNDREMEIMIYYLKNLSSKVSPGVTATEVRFATVVTDGVSPRDRNAMIDPLQSFINDWNAMLSDSPSSGARGHRKISLDVWVLKGPVDSWHTQLETLYRRQPVFALLGGISQGPWDPIHRFCEKNRIPCLFPITDLPVISENDFYTLYFSKGYYQEGETAAKFLAGVLAASKETQVVQVYRQDDQGKALSRGFAETWNKSGNGAVKTRVISTDEKTGRDFWAGIAASYKNAVMVVWLGPADLVGIEAFGVVTEKPYAIFVSSTMLAGALTAVPDVIRDFTYITYPSRLPGDDAYAMSIVENWMKFRKAPPTNMAITAKVFFSTRMLYPSLLKMRGDFYRDYFLDLFDVLGEQTAMIASYPRVTFGPGQRYASKGCYVVTLTKGPQPKIFSQTDWVIH